MVVALPVVRPNGGAREPAAASRLPLHVPFLLAMVALTLRQLVLGRLDLALQDTAVNLVLNVYPILHHRRTRLRIVGLLERARRRRERDPDRGGRRALGARGQDPK